jgi:hypothetical protein
MGSKTSVYLPDDLTAAWKASGKSLTDLIRAGLAAQDGPVPQLSVAPVDTVRAMIREELAALSLGAALPREPAAAPCSHTYPDVKTIMGKRVCTKCD